MLIISTSIGKLLKFKSYGSAYCDGQKSWMLSLNPDKASGLHKQFTLTTWFTTEHVDEKQASLVGMSALGSRHGWSVGRKGDRLMLYRWGDKVKTFDSLKLKVGQWYFMAMSVRDVDTVELLLCDEKGETQKQSTNLTQSFTNTLNENIVAASSYYQRDFWQGAIDDIRLYDRCLSKSEILTLAQGRSISNNH